MTHATAVLGGWLRSQPPQRSHLQNTGDCEEKRGAIPRSHDNPELLWIDDPEVIRDLIAVSAPVPGHVVAQEVQHCDAEVLEGAVALVVRGMSVHQPP